MEIEFEMEAEQLAYEQDKVIKGVLHYLEGDHWVEYSKEELTAKLIAEQEFYLELANRNYSSNVH